MPIVKGTPATIEFGFLDQSVEIDFDFGGVLVGVDFEITKLAALATERYMKVETEWIFSARCLIERLDCVSNILRFPLRKRWIIGNKIIPDFRAFTSRISSHQAVV